MHLSNYWMSSTPDTFNVSSFNTSELSSYFISLFEYHDEDGDEFLNADELRDLIISPEFGFEFGSVEEILSKGDQDGDGKLSTEEFHDMMMRHCCDLLPPGSPKHEEFSIKLIAAPPAVKGSPAKQIWSAAREMFNQADQDANGFLDEFELVDLMLELFRGIGTQTPSAEHWQLTTSYNEKLSTVRQCLKVTPPLSPIRKPSLFRVMTSPAL